MYGYKIIRESRLRLMYLEVLFSKKKPIFLVWAKVNEYVNEWVRTLLKFQNLIAWEW